VVRVTETGGAFNGSGNNKNKRGKWRLGCDKEVVGNKVTRGYRRVMAKISIRKI